MKKFLFGVLVVLLTAFLAACSNSDSQSQGKDGQEQGQEQKQDEKLKDNDDMPDDKVVATVNGEEIKNADLKQTEKIFEQQYQMFGQDPSKFKEQIQKQALDNLINVELIKQSAKEQGIKVSEEEVSKEFNSTIDRLKKQSKSDDVQKILEQINTTEKQLKEDIRTNIISQKYIDETIKVSEITEDALKKEYENYKSQMKQVNQEAKSFEEMKPSLEKQVKKQKENEQIKKLLDELRKENEVKILI